MANRQAETKTGRISPLRSRADALAKRLALAATKPAEATSKKPKPDPIKAEPGDVATKPTIRQMVAKPLVGRLPELAILSLAINLLSLAVPIFVLQVYDRVVFHGGLATLAGLLIGVLAALTFDFVLRQARSRLVQMIALRIDISILRVLFDRLCNMPLRRMEGQSDAEWHSLLRDQETVRDTVAGPATVLLVDLPFIFLFVGVIWLVAQPIAWLLVGLIPIYVCLAALSSAVIGRASKNEQKGAEGRHVLSSELVAGRLTAKALGLGGALKPRWETAQADLIDRSINRGSKVDGFSNLSVEMAMVTTVIMTSVGALAIVAGELTIGGLIAANMLASRVVQPLVQLMGMWRGVARVRDAARRLNDVMGQPTDREESAIQRGRPKGAIALEAVDFRYEPTAELVLKNLTVSLSPGGMTGIFGLNGAGKTTLLNLLQGLYEPERGRVLLDGADMRQFGREDLTRWIGYVPQETQLFAGTIRENIAKLRDDIGDARVLAAARQSGADAFIVGLPEGYDTQVGEGGRRFSAGQRQRIALARALIDNPPVVLLDEPSAHLDAKATSGLIYLLRRMSRDRTVVVVSHSRELLQACQTVLVLDDATVVARGKGSEIVGGLFAENQAGVAA